MANLTDKSVMPWGKYKGEQMINIPAGYLIWCYENGKCSGDVKAYIVDNLDVLHEEIRRREEEADK